MPVADVSIENYYRLCLTGELSRRNDRVLRLMILANRPVTTHEVADAFSNSKRKIPIQSASSAFYYLRKAKLIKKVKRGLDPITGNPAWFHEPVLRQEELPFNVQDVVRKSRS